MRWTNNINGRAFTNVFLRQTKECMVAYYLLGKEGKALTPVNFEQLKKERKSHTDVIDIGFSCGSPES